MVNQEQSHSCQIACARQVLSAAGVELSEAALLTQIVYLETIMIANINEAKNRLESVGLHVSCRDDRSLWIAAVVKDAKNGIKISDDACALIKNADRWSAVFPAEGLAIYEMPGILADLVATISAVYAHYRQVGGPFKEAFRQVVSDPDR